MNGREVAGVPLVCLAPVMCLLMLAFGAASAHAQPLLPVSVVGSGGPGSNQFLTPTGVAVSHPPGLVYVADRANARVDVYTGSGTFAFAFGWGVKDGKGHAEVCGSNCQPGIPGSGPGQFTKPTSVAVDSTTSASRLDVYVGDQGTNVVQKFNVFGGFISSIDGSTTPQGKYSLVAGVSVDQSGNLWTADGNNDNVDEFAPTGKFLQEWSDMFASTTAIAVDSTTGKVYLSGATLGGALRTESSGLKGTNAKVLDTGNGAALGLDPSTHTLYVDHGGDVTVYNSAGKKVSTFSLVSITNSQGLAWGAIAGELYVSDAPDNNLTIFGPPTTPAAPLAFGESGTETGISTAALSATIVPFGLDTTCQAQYVDDATFKATGYGAATMAPCSPSDLGSSFAYQSANASLTGLHAATTYHFRFVATNAKGTTNGADQTFETGGPPAVFAESETASQITDTKATVHASVNPTGLNTTCGFQYVDAADFQASGYGNAKNAPCAPFGLGSSFAQQSVKASLTGLVPATIYHFRTVATNSAATTDGGDQTFTTRLSFPVGVGAFGSSGTAGGQFSEPVGVGAGSAGVFVADRGNARVEKFNVSGSFVSAWGWGVSDGKSQAEVCTVHCRAGIPGAGRGQFTTPTSIAVGDAAVYAGDSSNNRVETFSTAGAFVTVIDGTTTPQGHFQRLSGVAVDESGNLWTADAKTNNVDEFSPSATFLRQWHDTYGSTLAIAVDSTHGKVYLIRGSGATESWSLTGTHETPVDSGSPTHGTALSLDPGTGNLYIDHGDSVAVYDSAGLNIDNLYVLGHTRNSQGLAFRPAVGSASRLYTTDASNNFVTIWGPRAAGRPLVTTASASQTAHGVATATGVVVPLGFNTTCRFQYVDDATYHSSGYSSAASAPCAPPDLGARFGYAEATGSLSALVDNTTYHFRVVATNSAGTTTSGDQTFQTGPADWARFNRCPVDDPSMLAANGVRTEPVCVASDSPSGSITIGNITAPTGASDLQLGSVLDLNTVTFSVVSPAGGALVSAPVKILGGSVTATVQSAGTPSNFNPLNGERVSGPIITLPIMIHLTSNNPNLPLGPSCFIGSAQNPIRLHPAVIDASHSSLANLTLDPNGLSDPSGTLTVIEITGAVQADDSFAVPVANGCGSGGALDSTVDAFGGVPSRSGKNHLVLDDATSDLVLAQPAPQPGPVLAKDWHIAFG
jgi:hypothetical protein